MAALANISWASRALLWVGALAAPVALLSAYLIVSRWPNRWFNPSTDFIALGISVALGGACLWRLVTVRRWRIVAATVYAAAYCAFLFIFGFSFVCEVFQDCL